MIEEVNMNKIGVGQSMAIETTRVSAENYAKNTIESCIMDGLNTSLAAEQERMEEAYMAGAVYALGRASQSVASYTHTEKGGVYIVTSGLAIPAGDIKHLNKPLVVYQNSEGRVFVRTYESFLESFTLIA